MSILSCLTSYLSAQSIYVAKQLDDQNKPKEIKDVIKINAKGESLYIVVAQEATSLKGGATINIEKSVPGTYRLQAYDKLPITLSGEAYSNVQYFFKEGGAYAIKLVRNGKTIASTQIDIEAIEGYEEKSSTNNSANYTLKFFSPENDEIAVNQINFNPNGTEVIVQFEYDTNIAGGKVNIEVYRTNLNSKENKFDFFDSYSYYCRPDESIVSATLTLFEKGKYQIIVTNNANEPLIKDILIIN